MYDASHLDESTKYSRGGEREGGEVRPPEHRGAIIDITSMNNKKGKGEREREREREREQ